MPDIATACARPDLYAIYENREDRIQLPVIGWNDRGKAIVQKADGSIGSASAIHVTYARQRLPFVCVRSVPEDQR